MDRPRVMIPTRRNDLQNYLNQLNTRSTRVTFNTYHVKFPYTIKAAYDRSVNAEQDAERRLIDLKAQLAQRYDQLFALFLKCQEVNQHPLHTNFSVTLHLSDPDSDNEQFESYILYTYMLPYETLEENKLLQDAEEAAGTQ